MSNELFRACMPYVITWFNQELTVENRYRQELFSCHIRKSKELSELLKGLSAKTYREEGKIESFLYFSSKDEPFSFGKDFYDDSNKTYINKLNSLFHFFDNRHCLTEKPLENHLIREKDAQIREKDAQIKELLIIVNQLSKIG